MRKLLCAMALSALAGGWSLAASDTQGTVQFVQNHPVLRFLNLTQEQSDKINALYQERMAAVRDLYKNRPKDRAAMQQFYQQVQAKNQALEAEFQKKLMDVLTEEQKAKYAEVQKVQEEFSRAQHEAMIKLVIEREDKLVKILGDGYREQAEKIKQGMRQDGPDGASRGGITR